MSQNIHEEIARREKVARLVNTIDLLAVSRGLDPIRDAILAFDLVVHNLEWSDLERAAELKNPASDKTRAAVAKVYRDRERQMARTMLAPEGART
jgi:hypothetical protein